MVCFTVIDFFSTRQRLVSVSDEGRLGGRVWILRSQLKAPWSRKYIETDTIPPPTAFPEKATLLIQSPVTFHSWVVVPAKRTILEETM